MKLLKTLLAAVLVTAFGAKTAMAATTVPLLPAGKTWFEFVDKKGDPSRPVTVWMYVPAGCDANCPLQMVMHGAQRNGETYLGYWTGFADERKFIAVAPEFTRKHFPHDDDYTLGRVTLEADPEKWGFAVPEHLFDELKARYGLTATRYRLFGHSAGGQFVHRLHLLFPEHRANPIIAANPGWYTQLEWGKTDKAFKFPYNTIDSKIDESRARKALATPFVLMLGDADIDPNQNNLNKSAGANAQGAFRFARGTAFFDNARESATALKTNFAWQKVIVPGVAHDGKLMSKAAFEFMNEPKK